MILRGRRMTGWRAQRWRASSHGARQASWIGRSPETQHGDPGIAAQEPAEYGTIGALSSVVAAGRIELLGAGALDALGHAIGLGLRRRLVTGRGLGELGPRRLAGERPSLVLVAAKAEAPGPFGEQAAEIAEL